MTFALPLPTLLCLGPYQKLCVHRMRKAGNFDLCQVYGNISIFGLDSIFSSPLAHLANFTLVWNALLETLPCNN